MKAQQKALLVKTGDDHTEGLSDLNDALANGWRVVQVAPLGGAGASAQAAALVIIEQAGDKGHGVLEQIQEETEEALDDLLEGDGSRVELEELGIKRPGENM